MTKGQHQILTRTYASVSRLIPFTASTAAVSTDLRSGAGSPVVEQITYRGDVEAALVSHRGTRKLNSNDGRKTAMV